MTTARESSRLTKKRHLIVQGRNVYSEVSGLREEIVASALIRNMAGLILVFEGQGEFAAVPGGSSEREETPEETAIRESFEETGWGSILRSWWLRTI
jgi:8-oxo-dGTP pyrophosphatase MutT (NUDIX family)